MHLFTFLNQQQKINKLSINGNHLPDTPSGYRIEESFYNISFHNGIKEETCTSVFKENGSSLR